MESGNQKLTKTFLIIALVIIVALVGVIVFLVLNPLGKEAIASDDKGSNTSSIAQNEDVKDAVKQEEPKEETADDRMARYAQNYKKTYFELAKNEIVTGVGGIKTQVSHLNKFYINGIDLKPTYPDNLWDIYVDKDLNLIAEYRDSKEMLDSNVTGIYRVIYSQGALPIVIVTHLDGHVSYLRRINQNGIKIESVKINGVSNIVSALPCNLGQTLYYYFIDIDGNVINPLEIERKNGRDDL